MSRLFWRRRIKSFLALSIFVEGTSTAQQHLSFRLAYPCGHRQVRENSAPLRICQLKRRASHGDDGARLRVVPESASSLSELRQQTNAR